MQWRASPPPEERRRDYHLSHRYSNRISVPAVGRNIHSERPDVGRQVRGRGNLRVEVGSFSCRRALKTIITSNLLPQIRLSLISQESRPSDEAYAAIFRQLSAQRRQASTHFCMSPMRSQSSAHSLQI